MNTTANNKKYIWTTIYWTWNSAIWFSPLEHFRKDDSWKEKFMWFKLNITATPDLFDTKHAFYIESEELLNFLMVLRWIKNEMVSKRNSKTSNTNKSITLKYNGTDLYCKIDVQNSDKLSFKISELNKIILMRIVEDIIIKDIKETSWVIFNRNELIEYIKVSIKENNTKSPVNTAIPKDLDKSESVSNDDNESFQISYINTYKDKKYTNKIEVNKAIYDQVDNISKLSNKELQDFLSAIKSFVGENAKYININNILTLKRI